MNNCSISYEQHIHIWTGGDSFTKLWVSLLDSIFTNDDTSIFCAWSTDTNIHSQIEQVTVVSFLNNGYVSG